MAELLECLICGYKTVRCGMHNHFKAHHVAAYIGAPLEQNTKSLGQVKGWSKNRNQTPKEKA